MKITLAVALAACIAVAPLAALAAGAPPIPPSVFNSKTPLTLNGNATTIGAALIARPTHAVPVCSSGAQIPTNEAGNNASLATVQSRTMYYCPRGAKNIQLVFTGIYLLPGETDIASSPVPMSLSVEVNAPAPWSATKSYAIGAVVTHNAQTSNVIPIWTAAAANTGSEPSPQNSANWTQAGSYAPTLTPITCAGQPTCTLASATTAAGTAVTQGVLVTDPIAVNCAVGCWIAVRASVYQTSTQYRGVGPATQWSTGGAIITAASISTDTTLPANSGTFLNPQGSGNGGFFPLAVIGTPQTLGPTVCTIGDSRAQGVPGDGLVTTSVNAGGTGFVSGDVGRIVALPNTGATNSVGSSAQVMITGVSAGAVSVLKIYDPGSYAASGLPSSTQSLTVSGSAGTGLVANVTFSNSTNALEFGDYYGVRGMVNRGLIESGVPFVPVADAGDKLSNWLTLRDYTRMAIISTVGCSSVVDQLDINDMTAGSSAATIEAWHISLANALLANGVQAVYLTTTPPVATSTDGFATTTNQTSFAYTTVLNSVNVWKRTIPAPFAGYFETANAVSSAQDSDKWAVNASVCYLTCDGTHMTPTGYGLEAGVISAGVGMLQ